jgi:hypothetical protein
VRQIPETTFRLLLVFLDIPLQMSRDFGADAPRGGARLAEALPGLLQFSPEFLILLTQFFCAFNRLARS